jgi:hypothetical protein
MNQLNLQVVLTLSAILLSSQQPVLAQVDPRAAAANQELLNMLKMTPEQLSAQDAAMRKIYYCVKPIAKGQAIRLDQIEERAMLGAPIDCLLSTTQIVGKQPMFDIKIGRIISQRDFNIALTPSQNAALLARNYSGSKLPMGRIVFNRVPLTKGTVISVDQLGEAPMPFGTIPQDSITSPSLVAGRKAKFDKAKLQILMHHEIQ